MKTLSLTAYKSVLFFIVVLLSSCGDENDSPSPQSTTPLITEAGEPAGDATTFSIGAAGGTIQSPDGNIVVTIPADALPVATTLSIQPISNKAPLGIGMGYRLEPEGTTFSKPVTITFRYDENILQGALPDFLWIVTQAKDGSWNAMLRSEVDTNAKTVSVQASHFSDWTLGKFVDLSLNPSSYTIQRGQSVQLGIVGFEKPSDQDEEDELAPLIPFLIDPDGLAPLVPIPPVESRLMGFKVKGWTLNGTNAPVSNTSGSLTASDFTAVYKAPNKKPALNPVAVSVELESNNKEGKKFSFLLTSNITVVESDYYVLVTIDGKQFEYYQYGINGASPPDPTRYMIANCGASGENQIAIAAGEYTNDLATNVFLLAIENPSEGQSLWYVTRMMEMMLYHFRTKTT